MNACNMDNKSRSINGIWESMSSGWILEIRDSSYYSFYDINQIDCLPSKSGSFEQIASSLKLDKDTLSLKVGVTKNLFTQIQKIPIRCDEAKDSVVLKNPLFNFEYFAETVKEHYAFMKLNEIDWPAIYKEQKSKLTEESTEVELYLLIEETFEKLNDNHAYINSSDEVYDAIDMMTNTTDEDLDDEIPLYGDFPVADMVVKNHIQDGMNEDSWIIKWGKLTEEIGYIQVKAMWLLAELDIPQTMQDSIGFVNAYLETSQNMFDGAYIQKEVEGVNKIMKSATKDLRNTKSIVIDVRFNGGGQDAVSFEILRHFIPNRLQVAKQKFKSGEDYTSSFPLVIHGSDNAYLNPIYILTSPQTGSAAETFALATMAMKNAKRIGTRTEGALSTTLDKSLPNGWDFCVSNEVYMNNQNKLYENIGIPVDYEMNYSMDRQTFFRSVAEDLDNDKQMILKAIKEINSK